MDKKPIILVDGNNFLYRAYYSVSKANLTNSKGEPTGATKVYISMLGGLFKDFPQSAIAVVFDAHGPCFRHEFYTEYKANRKPMPDDLRSQVETIKNVIKAMGIEIISVPGVEADDVLGSYATVADKMGVDLIIASGDKDLAALVSDKVQVIDTMAKKIFDRDAVIEKYGVPPELIRDFLALKGDKADNIPGMSGIGDKTASLLLNTIGSIDIIKENLSEIEKLGFRGSKTFAEKFKEQLEQIELSRFLATIKTDVELPIPLTELQKNRVIDHKLLCEIYKACEFTALVKEEQKIIAQEEENQFDIFGSCSPDRNEIEPITSQTSEVLLSNEPTSESIESNLLIVFSEAELNCLCQNLLKVEEFSVVLLTDGSSFMQSIIVGIGIYGSGINAYIPLRHDYLAVQCQLACNHVFEKLSQFFSSEKVKICHDVKMIKHFFAREGVKFEMPYQDVMLESHMLDSSEKDNLNALASRVLYEDIPAIEDILGKGAKAIKFEDLEIDKAAEYISTIGRVIFNVHKKQMEQLKSETPMLKAYMEEEVPLIGVLFKMEEYGVYLDKNELGRQSKLLNESLASVKDKLFTLAGEEFNVSSPKQVGKILYEKMGLPSVRKTPSGSPSTSEDAITELAQQYEVPQLILEYRGLSKLINTYVDKLPTIVDPLTSRIHGCFNQNGTVTGRLSSSDPNLQNIPVRTTEGRAVRAGFSAPAGYKILAADYSQIELRLMAHIANEQNMIKAFLEGQDIHASTAAQMHGLSIEQVTPELRRSAKAINFGLIYGMSVHGLAKQLGIDNTIAKNYMERYFAQYPGVKVYMQYIKEFVHKNGYVQTFSGRKLMFKNIFVKNKIMQQAVERAAINAPMQGSAAEIIKRAMVNIDKWLETEPKGNVQLLMQVHDELVFEVREDLADEYAKKLSEIMSNVVSLKVPLLVGTGLGKNWSEAH